MTPSPRAARILLASFTLALLLFPLSGDRYWIALVTRMMSTAIFALSLDLLAGYTGLVSFGHAAFFGAGGYTLAVLGRYLGLTGLWATLPLSILAAGLLALGIGWLSIRTRGVYFIMITLAFAQMIYYLGAGLARYGGDDGLTIQRRSQFGSWLNLSNRTVFYYVCLALLLATIYFVWRLVNSRFGMVIQGARSNERRMRSIGFPTVRYRLTCFVIAGTLCGLSGALLANHTDFVSPAMMYWTRSGDLIVMVVLGGMASSFGPLIGAVALLVLEEALSGITEYWQIILGPLLLLVVLFARRGIDGLLDAAAFPRVSPTKPLEAKVGRG
ncbi:MAG: branched-chain amino acid ABC transporter permease [Xanthobacteraceae bacterium]